MKWLEKLDELESSIARRIIIGKEEQKEQINGEAKTYYLSSVYPNKEIQDMVMKHLSERD